MNGKMTYQDKLEKQFALFAWLDLPQRRRGMKAPEKIEELGISKRQYHVWKAKWMANHAAEHASREVEARARMERGILLDPRYTEAAKVAKKNTGRWTKDDLEIDPETWLNGQLMPLYKAISDSATKGNAQSQKLLAQLMGRLVEKSEVKLDFDPNEHTRRNLEADRRLREMGYRVANVPEKPALLSEKLCLDSGQGSADNSKMA